MNMETVKRTMQEGDRYIRMIVKMPVKVPEVIQGLGVGALEKYIQAFLELHGAEVHERGLKSLLDALQFMTARHPEVGREFPEGTSLGKTFLLLRLVAKNPFGTSETMLFRAGSMMRQVLENSLRRHHVCLPLEAA